MRRSKTWSVWLLGGYLWGQVACLGAVLTEMCLERKAAAEEMRLARRRNVVRVESEPFDGGAFSVDLAHEVVRLTLQSLYSDYRRAASSAEHVSNESTWVRRPVARTPKASCRWTWWDALVPAIHQHEWHAVGCVYGIGQGVLHRGGRGNSLPGDTAAVPRSAACAGHRSATRWR
jgi:hypothetical protein